jgi:DtxR family Mn-dependent transcriptional regulator
MAGAPAEPAVPTSTVEDYLKHLYMAQQKLGQRLVPNGFLAGSLGVTPGTATLMVKTLADSGLVDYEPRSGARLTEQGERLALHVLRRHRLVELFLVDVLKLDWAEVHEEADVLEHAISDKVLDRIDELLGRPTVDPHGDPIPSAAGTVARPDVRPLSACEPGETVQVARISDGDPAFLRFAEEKGLTPGTRVRVQGRDPMADAVTVRVGRAAGMALGTVAADRILVCDAER